MMDKLMLRSNPQSPRTPLTTRLLIANGLLVLILAALYIAIATLLGQVANGGARFESSIVAAVSFHPIRRWLNRTVGGRGPTPYEVLALRQLRSGCDPLMGSIPHQRGPEARPSEALVGDLAPALGLALRNTRLTTEFRTHVTELER